MGSVAKSLFSTWYVSPTGGLRLMLITLKSDEVLSQVVKVEHFI